MSKKSKERRRQKAAARSVPTDRLFSNEAVAMAATPSRFATVPRYVGTLGLYGFWRQRDTAIVTDRRILFGKGIFRRTEQSIPLTKVQDVGFTRRGLSSYAEVVASQRGRNSVILVGPMSSSAARRFVVEILGRC